ncbi:MAG: T9SS type A sorting domain-containing protein [Bacteroidales bacterium]|nr:T9SS type A sorting domain-containing protein [Bacteroidales bacterium]
MVKIINMPEGVKSGIKLYDLQGRMVYETNTLSTFNNIDITHLPAGTYVMRITIGDQVAEWKVVKKNGLFVR